MNAVTKAVLALGTVLAAVSGILSVTPSSAGVVGRIIVAGHGPELPVMQDLGGAFEKTHPGTAIDFEWDRTVKAVERVKAGGAQVAVTDQPDPALTTVPIAWDGIAVIVNFANPVNEVTTAQVRDLFTGNITHWSALDGGDQVVEVLPRAAEANMQFGLEMSLGIAGQFRATGKPVRTDEKTLRAVSGRDRAISYLSLAAALKAQADGIPIRILTVDKVEAGQPTVSSGKYKLRRPVLLLTPPHPDPLAKAFVEFATSSDGQKILQQSFVPYTGGTFEPPPPTHLTDSPALQPKKQQS